MYLATFVVGIITTLGLHLVKWVKFHVPRPYMDEIFHVPQAMAYCKGDFSDWDDKITTPPGL